MRKLPIILLAATMFAGSAAAVAAPRPAGSSHPITAQLIAEVEGDYRLSDGRTMQLKSLDNRLYASIGKHVTREMVMVGENAFASKDGSISMRIKPLAAGHEIVLTHDRDLPTRPRVAFANDRAMLISAR